MTACTHLALGGNAASSRVRALVLPMTAIPFSPILHNTVILGVTNQITGQARVTTEEPLDVRSAREAGSELSSNSPGVVGGGCRGLKLPVLSVKRRWRTLLVNDL